MNIFYEEDGHFKVASIMSETGGALQIESQSSKLYKTARVALKTY